MKENRYIEILRWAYGKRCDGFTEQELFQKFNPNNTNEFRNWYRYVFRGNLNNEDCLIGHYDYKDNSHYSCLTAKGLSAAVGYLGLEEAQKTGQRAEKIAIVAIVIGTVVGIAQLLK